LLNKLFKIKYIIIYLLNLYLNQKKYLFKNGKRRKKS
jgi:hypothetical protein